MRFTSYRKAAIIRQVRDSVITATEAKEQYGISDAEWNSWLVAFELDGREGLMASNLIKGARNVG